MTRQESIRKHVSDMLAIERYVLETVDQQLENEKLVRHKEARDLVIEIHRVLDQHVTGLEKLAKQYGARTEATIKALGTQLLGVATGVLESARGEHPGSRTLRDDYVALSLVAMAYTSFHTYGLAMGEERISRLGQQHLADLTPLMVALSKKLPEVVSAEVEWESDFPVNGDVGPEAVANTQRAWSREIIESAS